MLQFYATISDFTYDVTTNNEERLQKRGGEFGDALGKTIVGGVKLFNLSYDYCYNIGYTGEYYKPFRDVVSLANAIDMKWKLLPLREQERIKAELVTNLLADGVITAGGAKTISQLPRFTQILDNVADETKVLSASIKDVSNKAADRIAVALDDITKLPPGAGALRPAYGYATGLESSKGWREKIGDYILAMGNPEKDKLPKHKKAFEVSANRRAKGYSWLDGYCEEIERDAKNVVKQENENACVFACGEMVSEGELKQPDLIRRFCEETHPQFLEKYTTRDGKVEPLGDLLWISKELGSGWVANTFQKDASKLERLQILVETKNSWIAELKSAGYTAHAVVAEGLDEYGRVIVRDPGDKTKYLMSRENFFRFWTGNCVFKKND